jgi:MFS family permease
MNYTLARGFWLVFGASALTCVTNGATTPMLAQFVGDELGGTAMTAGLLIGLTPLISVLTQPAFGVLADRRGRRGTTILGCAIAALGLVTMALAWNVATGAVARSLFGMGGAAINTACMAWVVDTARPGGRSRPLSLFGISIWIGLAIGPQIGEMMVRYWGYRGTWAACAGLQVLAIACVLRLRESRPDKVEAGMAAKAGPWSPAMLTLVRPGLAVAIAWAAEAVLLAFLIPHLRARGLAAGGIFGAASIFTLFAVSVVAARVLIGSVPDRVGPVRTAVVALITVAAGMAVLAGAASFATAAFGAVLLGFGFAPLYPALTILATRSLPSGQRAAGLGGFNSLGSLGAAGGSLVGGILVGWKGTTTAFVVAALAQLAAAAIVGTAPGGLRSASALPPVGR